MPTGSLCAERNVIGSALADDLTLRREDIKFIAVLGVKLDALLAKTNASGGRGFFQDGPAAAAAAAATSAPPTIAAPPPLPVLCGTCGTGGTAACGCGCAAPPGPQPRLAAAGGRPAGFADMRIDCAAGALAPDGAGLLTPGPSGTGLQTPAPAGMASPPRVRRLAAYNKVGRDDLTTPSSYRRTFAVDHADVNPLKPCGACTEWLKKISEVNPSLRIITFTDLSMQGMYVGSVGQM